MWAALLTLAELGLLIYCLVDVIETPDAATRNLPKWAWILAIALLPWVGAIAWLIIGRPEKESALTVSSLSRGRTRTLAPDDDPDFLRDLDRRRQGPRDDEER
jgi:hypothetical protein